jgi:steroid Delta-isomerase
MHQQQTSRASTFLSDCERIHREWHARAKALDSEGLLALYAADAVLESPLVTAILVGRASGILRGHDELRLFFAEGARRRPNELVRWYRTGTWLTDGERLLVWEYPRAAPDGDQVDILEVLDIVDGSIQHHRIYWGWFGSAMLTRSAIAKAGRADASAASGHAD